MHLQFAEELWSSPGVYILLVTPRYSLFYPIPLNLEKNATARLRGAADLLLQFSLHSLLKTLQNQEVECTLQQLEAGGVLLGMVKGQFFDVVFCAHHPGAKAP